MARTPATPDPAPSTQEVLSSLHDKLARHLLEKLREQTITAAELGVLERFLKSNGITAQPVKDTPFGDLVNALPDLDKVIRLRPRRSA